MQCEGALSSPPPYCPPPAMPQTSSGLGLDSEFPPFLPNFNGLKIVPDKLKVEAKKWNATITLTNTTDCGVLYKVKCTSNKRIKIENCADIVPPGKEALASSIWKEKEERVTVRSIADPKPKDQLNVVFVLVGKQWLAIDNAYKCWRRVKGYTMPTRNKLIEVQVD